MKLEYFIAKRILFGEETKKSFTKPVINIAVWGISLGVIIMLMAVSVTKGFQKEIKKKIVGFASDVQITKSGIDESYESAPIALDSILFNGLMQLPEIRKVQTFATKAGIIKTQEATHGIILKGIQENFDWNFFKQNLIEGDTLVIQADEIGKDAIVSKKIADKMNLKLGDKFRVFFVTKTSPSPDNYMGYSQKKYAFTIKGIYQTGLAEEFDSKIVFIDLKRIQKLNGWGSDTIGGYEVFLSNNQIVTPLFGSDNPYEKYLQNEEIIRDNFYLETAFLDVRSIFTRYPAIISWIDYMDMHIAIILVIILIVSIVNMSSALLIIILEKTQLIGILKSLGATDFSVRKIFIFKSIFLIGKGMIIGNVIAAVLCLIQIYFEPVKLDPDIYYVTGIPLDFNLWYWLLINLITISICSMMLILPSILISYISPVKAIRFN